MMNMVSMEIAGLLLLTLVACAGVVWVLFQKRSAQALAGVLRAALDSARAGILVVDKRGRTVASNRRFSEIWKVPESIAASRDDSQAVAWACNQLKSPESRSEERRVGKECRNRW